MNWLYVPVMWVTTAVAVSVAIITTGSAWGLLALLLPALLTPSFKDKSDKKD